MGGSSARLGWEENKLGLAVTGAVLNAWALVTLTSNDFLKASNYFMM